ncbi:hypothetical protein JAAARDRAFT_598772 [Jaapia argillacea MUCL 33604]|uniref:Isoleucine--tRNA ligase, mitochondrial n=1 Tax=Jaapia argillacea MUCL 33604 TaxID=933084 RepID=A0A067PZE0_9AGAM|nr:hypothetical protein JAAARDRAFT_598772 [Jaapia argillacea MUCL 33604]
MRFPQPYRALARCLQIWTRNPDLSCQKFSTCTPVLSRSPTNHTKSYSDTLLLPKTELPLRNDPAKCEAPFRKKSGEDLYRWQWQNAGGPLFVLHDGPPYANGNLHMGHAMNKIIKDIINRFHVIWGRKVHYLPGWDCHGLPIENKVLQKLGKDQLSLSPKAIRVAAKEYAEQEVARQKEEFSQFGIMADWSKETTYRTMDHDYEMRQLHVFKKMVEAGLIYRNYRPVHYSPSSRSALAEAELTYKDDHLSHSVYVSFTVDIKSEGMSNILRELFDGHTQIHLLVWTTTPWTLTANMGIAVHSELDYSVLRQKKHGNLLIVGADRVLDLQEIIGEYEEVAKVSGSELVGTTYLPLFSRHADAPSTSSLPIVPSAHVTSDSGTGLVHCAPAHGAEDYTLFRSLGLIPNVPQGDNDTILCHVNQEGKFTSKVADVIGESTAHHLIGKEVLGEGAKAMSTLLSDMGVLAKIQKIKHRYPYDWKTDKPIIMLATSQWFADLTSIKESAVASLEEVVFFPLHSRNRLDAFVRSRSEWCISRQRVWGVPIPALYHVPTDAAILDSQSVDHILTILQEKGVDYWWDGPVEEFVPPHLRKEGENLSEVYRKGTDTMDVWFDSGTSWTMLQESLPKDANRQFYADVCVEGSDQHRGWFQSQLLTAIGTAEQGSTPSSPYGTLITHGMVLDPVGKKMSKSLGNIVSPMTILHGGKDKKKEPAYGADILRLWVATVEYWRDAAIGSLILVQCSESMRKIRNSARFMLGNLNDGKDLVNLQRVSRSEMSLLDKYVMHELQKVESVALEAYSSYNFPKVVNALSNFVNITLSLYFGAIKDCLYTSGKESVERRAVQTVLEQTINTMTSIIAPILPHLAEEIYHILQQHEDKAEGASVFTKKWSPLPAEWEDALVEKDMNELLRVRAVVLSLLENAREQKLIGSSLEAEVEFVVPNEGDSPTLELLRREGDFLETLFIVSAVSLTDEGSLGTSSPKWLFTDSISLPGCEEELGVRVLSPKLSKCPRCWTFTRHEDETLCKRCSLVVEN